MSGPVKFKIEGLREMDAALGEMKKATAKAVLRRVGKAALIPMADAAEAKAPVLTGHLRDSITIGQKLTTRQARLNRKRDDKDFVEIFMGPNDVAAVVQEFGTVDNGPQPYMRPAFATEAQPTIDRFGKGMWPEIDKAAARARARALKVAANGK